MLGTVQDSLLSLIFPQKCHICSGHVSRRADGTACPECWEATRLFERSELLCNKCGAVLGDKAAPVPVYCHQCDEHHYNRAAALGVYEKGLAAAVIALKSRPFLPGRVSDSVQAFTRKSDVFDVDMIVPVPLSVQRQKERGFNQAYIIARSVGLASGLPVDSASLVRSVHTPMHRGGMDQKAREQTVKKAFKVVRPLLVAGKRIVLIDDVLTSGSTASACAEALKKSGVAAVNVFTLARAVLR